MHQYFPFCNILGMHIFLGKKTDDDGNQKIRKHFKLHGNICLGFSNIFIIHFHRMCSGEAKLLKNNLQCNAMLALLTLQLWMPSYCFIDT